MSSLIGNLVTLAIVLVFFFAYHRLTANNRSLEKVKKLAEKLQNDLDGYVGSRAEELKHYGIDLDVQQKAAKIALEKLQAAQAAVSEKADAIGQIADRFKEYDEVLAKLMDMTARVDQNLARIHEDETFAEGVNRKLELAKKGLAAIERELPLLRESFAQDAQRTVDEFRDGVLSDLQEGLDATATELHAVRDEATAAFAKAQSAGALVDEELGVALETAKGRAADIEDAAFATLTESFGARLKALEESSDAQLARLGQDTAQRVGELSSAIAKFKDDWKNEAEGMLADMTSKLGEAEEIFARKATEIAALVDLASAKAEESEGRLAAAAEKAETGLADAAARADSALTGASAQAKTELATAAAEAQGAAEATLARLASLETSLRASMEAASSKVEEEFAQFGQAFEDHRTRFEENFMVETKALSGTLASLRGEIEELKASAYGNAQDKLEGFEDELLAELSKKKGESFRRMDAWLSDMEKTLGGIVAEAGARRNAEEARHAEEFKAHLVKVRDDLHGQLARMGKDVDAIRGSIAEQRAAATAELEALKPALRGEIDRMVKESVAAAAAPAAPEAASAE
ncbi:hypothetical protein LWX53_10645 [bacterium]|nr:hypothetical protein [bacterium]